MQKYNLKDLLKNRTFEIAKTDIATIYYLSKENQILKVFKKEYLSLLQILGINLEEKILLSEKINISPNIAKPINIVYDNNNFIGYTMEFCKEKTFNQWDEQLTLTEREDLYKYAKIHHNLEQTVKESKDIVIPDLCTCDNILVRKNGTVKLIDYDGFQVKDIKTISGSTNLGNPSQYIIPKYNKNGLFTKELDKKSLIVLYFLSTFNVDLNKVGEYNPVINRVITLDDIFYNLNLFDADFNHKVWKIFQDNEQNEYLGEDMFRIADKYNMVAKQFYDNYYIKKLIRK